jgi:hypothetical protein
MIYFITLLQGTISKITESGSRRIGDCLLGNMGDGSLSNCLIQQTNVSCFDCDNIQLRLHDPLLKLASLSRLLEAYVHWGCPILYMHPIPHLQDIPLLHHYHCPLARAEERYHGIHSYLSGRE